MNLKLAYIESLRIILSTVIKHSKDPNRTENDYWTRRVGGFLAEFEAETIFLKNSRGKSKLKVRKGGQFISARLTNQNDKSNCFMYTTVDLLEPKEYAEIYQNMAQIPKVKYLYYLKVVSEPWHTDTFFGRKIQGKSKNGTEKKVDIECDILIPKYLFYKFDTSTSSFLLNKEEDFLKVLNKLLRRRKKLAPRFPLASMKIFNSIFSSANTEQLRLIYATRFFIDIYLRDYVNDITDLDLFVKHGKNHYLLEIKAKAPFDKNTKRKTSGNEFPYFGWDSRRLLWYLFLSGKTQFRVIYFIKNTSYKNRIWECISMEEFLNHVSWSYETAGGANQGTLTVPLRAFTRFSKSANFGNV